MCSLFKLFKNYFIFSQEDSNGPVVFITGIIDSKTLRLKITELSATRPHLLFSQPNYVSCPALKGGKQKWRTVFWANKTVAWCRLVEKRTNDRPRGSEGGGGYAFSGTKLVPALPLAVSCNRTVLWDGESHVCRRKGKFSTPKLLQWESREGLGWLFSSIFEENQPQSSRNNIAA